MKVAPVVVLLLLGLAFGTDRVVERWVERHVAEQLAERAGLAGPPAVDVQGFPFLTQAFAGRYDEVAVSLPAAETGRSRGTPADIALHGVHLPLSNVVSGSVEEIPVDRIEGTATLSYALLSARLGSDTELARDGDGDGMRITRSVDVLGRELRLTAAGQVTVEGTDLVVDVGEASGAGIDVPDFLLERATDFLDLRYTVPELPFGLQVTGVRPVADGVDVHVEAFDAVIATP